MRGIFADLRHAMRLYRATAVSSGMALLLLALAIGSVNSLAALWADIALKPHPGFDEGREISTVALTDGARYFRLSAELVEAIQDEVASVESVAGVTSNQLEVVVNGASNNVEVELVTEGFSGLRPRLMLGRLFESTDHEPTAARSVIVSFRFWQDLLEGRSDVIGETLRILPPPILGGASGAQGGSDHDYRIIGVFAPSMTGSFGTNTSLWVPFEQMTAISPGAAQMLRRSLMLSGLLRSENRANAAVIQSELNHRIAEREQLVASLRTFHVVPGVIRNFSVHGEAEKQVLVLLGGSAFLVLVAATNVSLFLLCRAPRRRRELAVRNAVGATRKRLVRQLATEVALFAVVATILGVVISIWLTAWLINLPFLSQAGWREVAILDWRVLSMVMLAMAVVTVLVSVGPIAVLERVEIEQDIRSASARASFGQRIAGTIQLIVAAIFAGGAVGFIWHLGYLLAADHGFDASRVHVISVDSSQNLAPIDSAELAQIRIDRGRRREVISSLPGIEAVTFASALPGRFAVREQVAVLHPRSSGDTVTVPIVSADVDFPAFLGMSIVSGATLASGSADQVLVNEALARALWGTIDVVGELLELPNEPSMSSGLRIAGVVGDVAHVHPLADVQPLLYREVGLSSRYDFILVRSALTATEVSQLLRRATDEGRLELEVLAVEALEDVWGETFVADRARMNLAVFSGATVLLLAGLGLYGSQNYLVGMNSREFAIRAAVGAGPRALGRQVWMASAKMCLWGVLIGGLLSFVVVAWLRTDFISPAVRPMPAALLVVVVAVSIVAAATVGPAARARNTLAGQVLRDG